MGAIIWLLIGGDINYFFVLGVLLVSSIAGVASTYSAGRCWKRDGIHRPAGRRTCFAGTIIAALLCLYYFLPLALATVCYLESRAKKLRAKNEKAMAK